MFIEAYHSRGHTYYRLVEKRHGKRVILKYLGTDPKPCERDIIEGRKAAEILRQKPYLAPKASQLIQADDKKSQVGKAVLPLKKYRAIVIDPPWPMEKILRDERPNQFNFDYPTMEIDEIKALPIKDMALDDGCHIYLWTTQKFLPVAFEVFEAWGVHYQCLMTWVKNVGFTPFSWMYSTEHCLFGRIGSLPLLKLGMRLDFEAKVREHSRKPGEFYNIVKQVSPEPRLDWFSREPHEGFEQYGNETAKFS